MLKKTVAFIVGFAGAFALLIVVLQALRVTPRGPGWLIPCIVAGVIAMRFVANPQAQMAEAAEHLRPVTSQWWGASPRLRLALIIGAVWVVAAYLIQDEYERGMKIVLIPPLALLALHFAEAHLVKAKRSDT